MESNIKYGNSKVFVWKLSMILYKNYLGMDL